MPPPGLTIEIDGAPFRVAAHGHDISIALGFDQTQPNFFAAPHAIEHTYAAGGFTGDVRRGGSCNCSTYTLTPHCNGTHTECVGHIVEERTSVTDVAADHLSLALLISTSPIDASTTNERSAPDPQAGDRLITRAQIEAAVGAAELPSDSALIVRTLPNDASKRSCNYSAGDPPPYFSAEAMHWIVRQGVRRLIVDLPSIDRCNDEGRLTAHRIFWGLPPGARSIAAAARPDATITELAFIDDLIPDGRYLLNLQVAPFATDAAPSRPILFALSPV